MHRYCYLLKATVIFWRIVNFLSWLQQIVGADICILQRLNAYNLNLSKPCVE